MALLAARPNQTLQSGVLAAETPSVRGVIGYEALLMGGSVIERLGNLLPAWPAWPVAFK